MLALPVSWGLHLRLQAVSLAAGGFVLGEAATLVLLDAAL